MVTVIFPVPVMFTVPASAALGATRMRVRLAHYQTVAPCGVHDYGEIEDYTIYITPTLNTPQPGIVQRAAASAESPLFETRIFPNPASGSCTVLLSGISQAKIRIVGMDGRIVHDARATEGEQTIHLEHIPPGIYVVRISDADSGHESVHKLAVRL